MKNIFCLILTGIVLFGCKSTERAEELPVDKIRLNQIGYYPDAPKIAAIASSGKKDFYIISAGQKEKYFPANSARLLSGGLTLAGRINVLTLLPFRMKHLWVTFALMLPMKWPSTGTLLWFVWYVRLRQSRKPQVIIIQCECEPISCRKTLLFNYS